MKKTETLLAIRMRPLNKSLSQSTLPRPADELERCIKDDSGPLTAGLVVRYNEDSCSTTVYTKGGTVLVEFSFTQQCSGGNIVRTTLVKYPEGGMEIFTGHVYGDCLFPFVLDASRAAIASDSSNDFTVVTHGEKAPIGA